MLYPRSYEGSSRKLSNVFSSALKPAGTSRSVMLGRG